MYLLFIYLFIYGDMESVLWNNYKHFGSFYIELLWFIHTARDRGLEQYREQDWKQWILVLVPVSDHCENCNLLQTNDPGTIPTPGPIQTSSFSIILVEFDEFNKIKLIKNHRLDQEWSPRSLADQPGTLTKLFAVLVWGYKWTIFMLGDSVQFI